MPERLPTLVTEREALERFCPLLNGNCRGSRCMHFRWSKELDRKTSAQLAFCGGGGASGAWRSLPVSREQLETI